MTYELSRSEMKVVSNSVRGDLFLTLYLLMTQSNPVILKGTVVCTKTCEGKTMVVEE